MTFNIRYVLPILAAVGVTFAAPEPASATHDRDHARHHHHHHHGKDLRHHRRHHPHHKHYRPSKADYHHVAGWLHHKGFVSWDEIEWDDGLWEVDDARRANGSQYDLKLHPHNLFVVKSRRER